LTVLIVEGQEKCRKPVLSAMRVYKENNQNHLQKRRNTKMPLDIGIGFEDLERMAKPPLVADGTYETVVDKMEDSPVQQSGRPQWKITLKIVNRVEPEFQNRFLFIYAQLPWIDPDTKKWDYSNTFTLVNLINGTGMQIQGNMIPDKELFQGRGLVVRVSQVTRKGTEHDPDPIKDNRVQIVTKKRGGGLVS
jgi:hypothetical protein